MATKDQLILAKSINPRFIQQHMAAEAASKGNTGELLRQIILGGQDGLVNVLGIILGVAKATNDNRMVMIAGLAATFAESISMGAVAYTSSQATRDYYMRELEREKWEIKHLPEVEREEIRVLYMQKGFRGKPLEAIVKRITGDEKMWLETMMREELGFSENDASINSISQAIIVFFAALAGSLIPLVPFFFLHIAVGIPVALAIAVVTLFAGGAIKGRLTTGSPLMRGAEMAVIGMVSALAGYAVGAMFGAVG
jgi:VIT1/CCC1 family predicted Fe2+/Mn2+ transporter